MRYKVNDRLEAPVEENGFEESFWTCRVIEVIDNGKEYVIEYEELEEDDDSKVKVTVPPERLRPIPPDDSDLIRPYYRDPGEAIDVWDKDGWWKGYIFEVWDDHVSLIFPASEEVYTNVRWPDPNGHRVRSGVDWIPQSQRFRRRARKRSGVDHRSKRGLVAAAAARGSNSTGTPKASALSPVSDPATARENKKHQTEKTRGKDSNHDKDEPSLGGKRTRKSAEEAGRDEMEDDNKAKVKKAKKDLKSSVPEVRQEKSSLKQPPKTPVQEKKISEAMDVKDSAAPIKETRPVKNNRRAPAPPKLKARAKHIEANKDLKASLPEVRQEKPSGKPPPEPPVQEKKISEAIEVKDSAAPIKEARPVKNNRRAPAPPKLKARAKHIEANKEHVENRKEGIPFVIPKVATEQTTQRKSMATSAPAPAGRPSEFRPKQAIARQPSTREGASSARRKSSVCWCLDNLPFWIRKEPLRDALNSHVRGIVSVEVATTPLDGPNSSLTAHGGYAMVTFSNHNDASIAERVLHELCLRVPSEPLPLRPLIAHPPRIQQETKNVNGHLCLVNHPVQPHFAQANSLEYDMALEWRVLERVMNEAQNELYKSHARDIALEVNKQLTAIKKPVRTDLDERKLSEPPRLPSSGGGPFLSRSLWLKGVAPHVQKDALKKAFEQFGRIEDAKLVRDPVKRLTGHAMITMDSAERAAALQGNLQDMLFLVGGSPRPVEASLSRPGPPAGSQSIYDRAMSAVLGRSNLELPHPTAIELVRVPNSDAGSFMHAFWKTLSDTNAWELKAAANVRALMRSQMVEHHEMRRVREEERRKLARRQEERYKAEAKKLWRLKNIHESDIYQDLCVLHGLRFRRLAHNGAADVRDL